MITLNAEKFFGLFPAPSVFDYGSNISALCVSVAQSITHFYMIYDY
jgi:hypothetical protein